ncbi:hypothetical protein [Adoxophyes orana nucleopolyhedrovirus]|uniref:hypothetical protein n=1 Tax=Adoxophyes orana nucleopolyhedrovirus TaxID=542343 RepID=UPI0001829BDA|nr:hypothetical protein [Adoxophyes orana nucleopolyhedrovirus]ACF05301.1 hypothetical protein [Adoxophyes orana nucleopolyhedrovirus]
MSCDKMQSFVEGEVVNKNFVCALSSQIFKLKQKDLLDLPADHVEDLLFYSALVNGNLQVSSELADWIKYFLKIREYAFDRHTTLTEEQKNLAMMTSMKDRVVDRAFKETSLDYLSPRVTSVSNLLECTPPTTPKPLALPPACKDDNLMKTNNNNSEKNWAVRAVESVKPRWVNYCCEKKCFKAPRLHLDGLVCDKCNGYNFCHCMCVTHIKREMMFALEEYYGLNYKKDEDVASFKLRFYMLKYHYLKIVNKQQQQ